MKNEIYKTGVYKITNIVNGKFYIGSAAGKYGFYRRFYLHKYDLNKNQHGNSFLQKAYNKYGEDSFKFEILEIIEDKTKILEREQYYLDLLKPYNDKIGYNIAIIAGFGSQLGLKRSKQTIENQSMRMKNYVVLESTKKKISESMIGSKNHFYGKTHNKISIDKISNSSKGRCPWNRKPVIQFNLDDSLVRSWSCIAEAKETLKINNICPVCTGKRKTAGGFKWKYVD